MDKLMKALESQLNIDLVHMVISNQRKQGEATKVKVRPVLIKDILYFQEIQYVGQQVKHQNLTAEQMSVAVQEWLTSSFKQIEVKTRTQSLTALVNKKGKATIKIKSEQNTQGTLAHNRDKQYILTEGTPVDFLVDLGVMTKEGNIVRSKYDKFKQINRFLEFIEDIIPSLNKDKELTIIDFGCGKSYLTFAMYYYLTCLKKYQVNMIGLDLKTEVIESCNRLAKQYGYSTLKFYQGDIQSFEGVDQVDMVVTLHACDTATDYALDKAVRWNAKVILSVPCCQHELGGQMQNDILAPILQYGLMKERFATIATDSLRAQLLEMEGYRTQLLEFIEVEHTPKNVLIRAVKTDQKADIWEKYDQCKQFLSVQPTLEKLLKQRNDT